MPNTLIEAEGLFPYTQTLRRDFHRYPELGFQEIRTAGIVARELIELGLEVTPGIGKTGVVALLEGAKPGPIVLLRFDMDALPIHEETGAPYTSVNSGVMHACGHDGHMAIGLSVARILNQHRQELAGTVKFMFQPAEEGLGGAESMIGEGVLSNPKPDACLALHLWNEKPLGWLAVTPGPFMAASETFHIHLKGRGGHGAMPDLAIDPVVCAAQIINALQTIIARDVSPLQSAVISVTRVRAGETFNVIPSEAHLDGTIRTFEPAVRKHLLQRFDQVLQGIVQAMGCEVDYAVQSTTPAVVNDPTVTELVIKQANQLFPQYKTDTQYRTMVSEDMAYVMDVVPGCYFFVGSANPELGLDASHHHPRFNFDENAMIQAAGLMSAIVLDALQ